MKTIQDLKTKMEVIKKTQIEGWVDIQNLGKWTGTTETSINNRVQEIEERISGPEDTIKEIDKRKLQIQQILTTKHPGNLGHDEKTKRKNNRGRRRRTQAQRHRKYIQQNHR